MGKQAPFVRHGESQGCFGAWCLGFFFFLCLRCFACFFFAGAQVPLRFTKPRLQGVSGLSSVGGGVAIGADWVEKVWSAPVAVPISFVATPRKWYSVAARRPVRSTLTVCSSRLGATWTGALVEP